VTGLGGDGDRGDPHRRLHRGRARGDAAPPDRQPQRDDGHDRASKRTLGRYSVIGTLALA
jgi:hypothetical protein